MYDYEIIRGKKLNWRTKSKVFPVYRLWRLSVASALFMLIIAPVNMFLGPVSKWWVIPFILLFLVMTSAMWLFGKGRTARIIATVTGAVCILITLAGVFSNPYFDSITFRLGKSAYTEKYDKVITKKQAKQDLKYAVDKLRKVHPACYKGLPEAVTERYQQAKQDLESADEVTVTLLAQKIQEVYAALQDAHTQIFFEYEEEHYMKYMHEHSNAGDVLISVNGKSLKELFEQNAGKISCETEAWGIRKTASYAVTLEGLAFLDIPVQDGVVYTYETKDGGTVQTEVQKKDFLSQMEYADYYNIDEETIEADRFVSYEIDKEHNLAVLKLTECINNEEYRECIQEMFAEVKKQHIENVAVDLRNNGGGNSSVATEFLKYIDVDSYQEWGDEWRLGIFWIKHKQRTVKNEKKEDFLFQGNLYLLTSASTFSSAMQFVEYVKDNQLGMVIGETPGNAPDGYGEISVFFLPRTGIRAQISTKKWHRIDEKEGLLEPDIACKRNEVWDRLYEQCRN